MKYQQLVILLPCHSLEDFPTHHEGDDADGLLAAWSALWHPVLLSGAGAMPSWYRADTPPEDLADKLFVVPQVSESQLATGFAQRAERDAGCLIRGQQGRGQILDQALRAWGPEQPEVPPSLVADFLALGYCYLQVELLTRQMRYSSNLDEIHFQTLVLAAAEAACQGDSALAEEKLQACFDVLAEERDHYYPVEASILDLTLVAPTTLGAGLRQQLAAEVPCNLVISAATLQKLAEHEPESLQAILAALEADRLGLVVSEGDESRLPLLPCEAIRTQLARALDRFERILGRRPVVYGRRRFGLTPALPQILRQLGFSGALHFTLEDGSFPEGSQVKVRWEGCDGTTLDAVARAPLDATRPKGYLNYGVKLGESMDMDHVATMCLAHWPGNSSVWYADLRRIARFGAALGKFVTVEQYFADTDLPVHQDRFRVDQYRSPYLAQAVARGAPDPISSVVRYWRRRAIADATKSLSVFSALMAPEASAVKPGDQQDSGSQSATLDDQEERTPPDAADDLAANESLQQVLAEVAERLPRGSAPPQAGCLVVNPHSFVRRIGVQADQLPGLPAVDRPIYAAAEHRKAKYIVVDVPATGFAWIDGSGKAAKGAKAAPPLADTCLLQNEFFEASIDPHTGTLRGIQEYGARGARLSQQLAMRLGKSAPRKSKEAWQDPNEPERYSVMAADSVETTLSTPAVGEIVCAGRLLDRSGNDLATFRQAYRLWRGSRVLLIDVELQPKVDCEDDPWNSYFAARFAWAYESATLYRDVHRMRHATEAKRFEAPHYVEIDDGGGRMSILTGGLPFHRRQGMRMLDSLLIVRGETCRRFRLAIGVDLKHPLHDAMGLLTPETQLQQTAAAPAPNRSGWLFHLDSRHVTATDWEPVIQDGRVRGVRVRLLETGGRPAKVGLTAYRPIDAARRVDLTGDETEACAIEDGKAQVQLAAHQWIQLEATWT
jgi:alpha-mannosidase